MYAHAQVDLQTSVSITASVAVSSSTSTSTDSGGGNTGGNENIGSGGDGGSVGSTINFSGRAYPLSKVILLKDSVPLVETIAGPDAKFSISVSNVGYGNYNFTMYGEDSNGQHSQDFSFPLIIAPNVTIDVSGIFISPTISLDKTQVVRGDNITIFGQSIPNSTVIISVHSNNELFESAPTDKNGVYSYTLDTSPLEIGDHVAQSKTVATDSVSSYGKSVDFTVADKSTPPAFCGSGKGDLNCSGGVDIVDYSILSYWYGKDNPPAIVDLNHDGVVDLVDFSILAYYWTGN